MRTHKLDAREPRLKAYAVHLGLATDLQVCCTGRCYTGTEHRNAFLQLQLHTVSLRACVLMSHGPPALGASLGVCSLPVLDASTTDPSCNFAALQARCCAAGAATQCYESLQLRRHDEVDTTTLSCIDTAATWELNDDICRTSLALSPEHLQRPFA